MSPGRSAIDERRKGYCGRDESSIAIELRPFSAQLQESLLREKLMATLSGGFGLLAGLLATLGLYGVIAYMVARRRNEIGVRLALGADRGGIIRLVLGGAVLMLAIGLSVGAVLALWAGKAADRALFGLQPNDPVSLVSAGTLLAVIALVSSYIPARRAAAVDPMTTLRNDRSPPPPASAAQAAGLVSVIDAERTVHS